MNKTIPKEVTARAEKLFCGEAEFVGVVDGSEVYAEHTEESETPDPTGLPTYILWDGRKVKVVSGLDSLPTFSPSITC